MSFFIQHPQKLCKCGGLRLLFSCPAIPFVVFYESVVKIKVHRSSIKRQKVRSVRKDKKDYILLHQLKLP